MLKTIKIFISNPYEMEYGNQSEKLTLTHVDKLGNQAVIEFDAQATRSLCELIGASIQANQGLLGRPSQIGQRH